MSHNKRPQIRKDILKYKCESPMILIKVGMLCEHKLQAVSEV